MGARTVGWQGQNVSTLQPMRYLPKTVTAMLLGVLLLSQSAIAQIIDIKSGKEISAQVLAERLRTADIVLLGELHDNVRHHELRGRLIAQFADPGRTVVAEHLPDTGQVVFQSDTRADLEAAGFDAAGWEWPAHQALYEQIRARGLTLVGGNLPKERARQIFLQGVTGLPDRMAQTYASARLDGPAEKSLDHDLIEGHCGKLPDRYLLRMRFAQRIADIAMAHALLDHRPSVLVAGNGHVRKDYGVPQVLAAAAPTLKQLSVGFLERSGDPQRPVQESAQDLINSVSNQYDFVWLTERAERKDPCQDFKLKQN